MVDLNGHQYEEPALADAVFRALRRRVFRKGSVPSIRTQYEAQLLTFRPDGQPVYGHIVAVTELLPDTTIYKYQRQHLWYAWHQASGAIRYHRVEWKAVNAMLEHLSNQSGFPRAHRHYVVRKIKDPSPQ